MADFFFHVYQNCIRMLVPTHLHCFCQLKRKGGLEKRKTNGRTAEGVVTGCCCSTRLDSFCEISKSCFWCKPRRQQLKKLHRS